MDAFFQYKKNKLIFEEEQRTKRYEIYLQNQQNVNVEQTKQMEMRFDAYKYCRNLYIVESDKNNELFSECIKKVVG